ncbi:tyrosine-type recombinase/integrase [Frigoriglobus tundricola]|uniref:Tyr recombinase domain-containing protein n=1 Tax=Frigoriglobus tundricola TaxID=2774151 RepID=A0A6M5YFZ8_9BACT|nr:tyrosine-type recombinase/integrase [Frigoriglobus tundricola]QJW92957.1 hypothetical protein FTUN_0455 [Frigoriglobus tundricola]
MARAPTILTHNNKSLPLREWARLKGISPHLLHKRLSELKWDVARAIDTPVRQTVRRGGRHKAGVPRPCPALKKHPSGRAYVRWKMRGRTFERYFGAWGSAKATADYRRFALEWATGLFERPTSEWGPLTVKRLADAFLAHAEREYVKHGEPTSEYSLILAACRGVNDLYADTPAAAFLPNNLRIVREGFVKKGLTRNTCNAYASRIVRMFGWAVGQSLITPDVHLALKQVEHLKAGRTSAPDREPRKPVSDDVVTKTLTHLGNGSRGKAVAAMVQVQRLTGMRPGEVAKLRPCDLDRGADVWRYEVPKPKNIHRGKHQAYYLGPKAVAILSPFVEAAKSQTAPLFGILPRAYTQAIRVAARRAGVPAWTSHQLRHALATEVATRFRSLSYAAAAIGDSAAIADAVYVHVDPNELKRIEIARLMG